MPDLESLLDRLILGRVEFVIVGGFAAFAHGATLYTEDIDICCRFSADNLMRLQGALRDLHPGHRMTPSRVPLRLTADECRGLKDLYLDTDYGQLDCIGFVTGVGDYQAVEKESVEIQLPGGPCRILKIDALIRAKEALGRPRDVEAVLQLKAIRERLARKG